MSDLNSRVNVVFVKHPGCRNKYAFSVPDNLVPYVKKGTDMLVETRHGLELAQAVTGVLCGEGAEDIALQGGAHLPLSPVVCVVTKQMFDAIRMKVEQDIMNKVRVALLRCDDDGLPY
jgi:hypothetical protein